MALGLQNRLPRFDLFSFFCENVPKWVSKWEGGKPPKLLFFIIFLVLFVSSWFCTPGEPKATKVEPKGAKMTPKIKVFGSKMARQCAQTLIPTWLQRGGGDGGKGCVSASATRIGGTGRKAITMRRGRALPCLQRRARSFTTSCQRHANALQRKKETLSMTLSHILFFPASDLHSLTPCLKG